MAIEVYGIFDNKEDVIKKVETLSLKGVHLAALPLLPCSPKK